MSLCDRCHAPGQCCRDLSLSTASGALTTWADEDPAEQVARRLTPGTATPFVPLAEVSRHVVPEGQEDAGRTYVLHRWACSALGPDGRCTVYERRPQLCRDFEPGSDALCVHWRGAEGDERSILS